VSFELLTLCLYCLFVCLSVNPNLNHLLWLVGLRTSTFFGFSWRRSLLGGEGGDSVSLSPGLDDTFDDGFRWIGGMDFLPFFIGIHFAGSEA